MAIEIKHDTAADGTFSAAGAIHWNAAHAISGLAANQLLYSTDPATLAQSANLTFDGSTFAALGKLSVGSTVGQGPEITAGTAASAVSALDVTQTWNFAASPIVGVKWAFTDTSSHAGALALQILGTSTGTDAIFQVTKNGFALGGIQNGGNESSACFAIGDGGSGLYRAAANQVAVTAGGWTASFVADASKGFYVSTAFPIGFSAGVNMAPSAGISWLSAGNLAVGNGTAGDTSGTIRAKYKSSDGTAGVASFGPSIVTSITIKDGLVVAIS